MTTPTFICTLRFEFNHLAAGYYSEFVIKRAANCCVLLNVWRTHVRWKKYTILWWQRYVNNTGICYNDAIDVDRQRNNATTAAALHDNSITRHVVRPAGKFFTKTTKRVTDLQSVIVLLFCDFDLFIQLEMLAEVQRERLPLVAKIIIPWPWPSIVLGVIRPPQARTSGSPATYQISSFCLQPFQRYGRSQNSKIGHVTRATVQVMVRDIIHLRTKFQVASFTGSRDGGGHKILNCPLSPALWG